MTPRRLVKIRSKKCKRAALNATKPWCKPLAILSERMVVNLLNMPLLPFLSGRNTWSQGSRGYRSSPIRFRVKRLGPLWFWRKGAQLPLAISDKPDD